jgi:hypothetical protein
MSEIEACLDQETLPPTGADSAEPEIPVSPASSLASDTNLKASNKSPELIEGRTKKSLQWLFGGYSSSSPHSSQDEDEPAEGSKQADKEEGEVIYFAIFLDVP